MVGCAVAQFSGRNRGDYLNRQRVMLPNEAQWQWAAAGDTGWAYPWGNEFDTSKCNSSVGERSYVTTKVDHYEGLGDSPFGVVDMCGNVEEWLVNREKDINDVGLMSSEDRAIRGGNWYDDRSESLQVNKRNWIMPYVIFDSLGFRIARYLRSER
jgi:formylglycine-generating enzyme required for sulfatase activity